MPYILGDSFGDLQRGENAADSNRRMALASAMNNAMQGLQFMTKQRAESEQSDQAQKNWEKQFGLQTSAADLSWERLADERARQQQANDIANKYVGLQERAVKLQEAGQTTAAVRAQQEQDQMILGYAREGVPGASGNEDIGQHLTNLFPNARKGTIGVATGIANQALRQQQDAYDKAASVADTLNNYDDLNSRIAAADKKVKSLSGHLYNSAGYDEAKQELDHLTASKATMDQYVLRLQKQVQDPKHPLSGLIAAPTTAGDSWNLVIHPPRRNPYAQQPGDAEAVMAEDGIDTSADTGGELTPVPRQSPAGAMVPRASAIPGAPTGTKYHPMVYTRAYQLMGSGKDPATAMRTALQEFQSAQAQGSIP